ncbi:hypothetical protein EMCRGX_G008187 [Ephydatia muelleri]
MESQFKNQFSKMKNIQFPRMKKIPFPGIEEIQFPWDSGEDSIKVSIPQKGGKSKGAMLWLPRKMDDDMKLTRGSDYETTRHPNIITLMGISSNKSDSHEPG